jgi:hypothetical protein
MKKFLIVLVILVNCQEYSPDSENESTWLDLIDPHEIEGDEPDCLHCSELRRPEDYQFACTAAKQIANLLSNCQCHTSDNCPNNCGWLDYLEPSCAESIDWYACEDFWSLCELDK